MDHHVSTIKPRRIQNQNVIHRLERRRISSGKAGTHWHQASFFVVYNMVTTEVIAVFENTSDELLELFENFCDLFRNATLHSEVQFPCSASSNNFARQIQRRFKDTIVNAKYGGHTEAVRRLLGQLPISAQSYSGSPYLDLSLFSYDDKWVSVMERPKTCGDHPIRYSIFTAAANCQRAGNGSLSLSFFLGHHVTVIVSFCTWVDLKGQAISIMWWVL
uniref:DET1 partner of COP1 E3 ubiquitin ligase n=1 Tax=Molossus molossus TaxID=27622 RepID=A0A7J8BKA1_MOLMO|nr:hypothetical protein HJG59_010161 [Molossus molossus]